VTELDSEHSQPLELYRDYVAEGTADPSIQTDSRH
jgi:hypothetical protein